MTYNGDLSISFSISSFGIVFVLFVGAINDWYTKSIDYGCAWVAFELNAHICVLVNIYILIVYTII